MKLLDIGTWKAARRIVLVLGQPEHGKTTSLLTCEKPIAIVSAPLEEGWGVIPVNDPFVKGFIFPLDFSSDISWVQTRDEVKDTITGIFAGKYGKFTTLAVDGLHKLHKVWQYAQAGTLPTGGEVNWMKVSPAVNHPFFLEIKRWQSLVLKGNPAGIQYLICTCWVALDKDNPNTVTMPDPRTGKGLAHEFPALSGQAGQQIVGEFTVKIKARRLGVQAPFQYEWLTKPDDLCWGVGIKAPPAIAATIPATLPQKWPALAKALGIGSEGENPTPKGDERS